MTPNVSKNRIAPFICPSEVEDHATSNGNHWPFSYAANVGEWFVWDAATRPIGGAGLLVAYPRAAAEKVEPAVTRAVQKVVGQAEGHHVQALKGALADAQRKLAEKTS